MSLHKIVVGQLNYIHSSSWTKGLFCKYSGYTVIAFFQFSVQIRNGIWLAVHHHRNTIRSRPWCLFASDVSFLWRNNYAVHYVWKIPAVQVELWHLLFHGSCKHEWKVSVTASFPLISSYSALFAH